MDKNLDILEASKLLGVTAQTLRNWDRSGKFKAHRHPMSNYRLYKKSNIDKLLKKIEGRKEI